MYDIIRQLEEKRGRARMGGGERRIDGRRSSTQPQLLVHDEVVPPTPIPSPAAVAALQRHLVEDLALRLVEGVVVAEPLADDEADGRPQAPELNEPTRRRQRQPRCRRDCLPGRTPHFDSATHSTYAGSPDSTPTP